ncbi:MAG TPA: peptide chain release factor N(5)-glutamine methyltransferase [Vicinamibacterales bacterium]|nr:peptide chain release factor N(5)-glutamine methyltransferase [Vicinamibacterales bacterium]
MITIRELVAAASDRLRDAGISHSANLDARLLAQHVLGWDTAALLASAGDAAPAAFPAAYDALVARRAAREPLAYITGHKEFYGLELEVTPAVLIPRPETELIVEAVLASTPETQLFTMIDVGTGSGNIPVAVAKHRRNARIVATDISAKALEVARRNAARHGVESRVMFVEADLFGDLTGPVDVITANPPYVPEVSRAGLQPEVGGHEPGVALFGGSDGLVTIQRVVRDALPRLRPGGYLIFEFGLGQDVEVEDMVRASGQLTLLDVKRDLQGIARTVVARASSADA